MFSCCWWMQTKLCWHRHIPWHQHLEDPSENMEWTRLLFSVFYAWKSPLLLFQEYAPGRARSKMKSNTFKFHPGKSSLDIRGNRIHRNSQMLEQVPGEPVLPPTLTDPRGNKALRTLV